MSLAAVSSWTGRRLRSVEVLATVDSTNAEALRRVDDERARDGAVLIAERQEAGRGSRGRSWHHVPGKSLALTALVGWTDARSLHLATWAAVVAATDVTFALGVDATIKWPNDALIDGRKFAGVLVETRSAATVSWAAIGVGMNVAHDARDFADAVALAGAFRHPPTSLREQGAALALEEAHRLLLDALDRRLQSIESDRGDALCRTFEQRLGLVGRRVVATLADREERGTLRSIDRDGLLLLEGRLGNRFLHGGHVTAVTADATG